MNDKYKEYVKLINLSCRLQNIRLPYIYFLEHTGSGIVLRDDHYKYISSDIRDFDPNVYYVKYICKENVIYINVNNLKNHNVAKALILRQTRAAYQYKQILMYKESGRAEIRESLIKQWMFAVRYTKSSKDYNKNSPIEVDRNAYSNIIMETLYSKKYKYEISEDYIYDDIYNDLRKQYNIIDVLDIACHLNIISPNIPVFDLDNFQN